MEKIAFLGAGQLALMTLGHAHRLGLKTVTVDQEGSPAHALAHENLMGDLLSEKTFEELLKIEGLTHATLDIERVSLEGLRRLEARGIIVHPSSRVMEIIRDKGKQREFLEGLGLPGPKWRMIDREELDRDAARYTNVVAKLPRGGYDGKGVHRLSSGPLPEHFQGPLLLEEEVAIQKELAMLVARSRKGDIRFYDPVEMLFDPKLNLMATLFSPARIADTVKKQMEEICRKVIEGLNYQGLLAIEFFLNQEDQLLINELAPRPHNSGHHTQVASETDQFEQHLRAVMGWPLGGTRSLKRALTVNVLGESDGRVESLPREQVLKDPTLFFQWYGKEVSRPGRKMGHLTLVRALEMNEEVALKEMEEDYQRCQTWLKI